MQLNQLGRIFRRSLWIILLTTLIGGAVAYAVGSTQRPVYSASVRMLFSPTAAASGSVSDLLSASTVLGNRIATYTSLVNSPLILDPVIQELGLDATAGEISSAVTAATAGASNVLTVTATSSDSASSAALANAVAQSLADQVTATESAPDAEVTGPTLQATVAQAAAPPSLPSAPDIPLMTVIGLAVGFAVGVLVAAIRAYADPRTRSRSDLLAAVDDPDLVVGPLPRGATKRFVLADDPTDVRAEAYRRFRAQLRTRPETGGAKRIVVTSPTKSKGVAVAALNLAAVIAEEGASVCILDGDLRVAEVAGLAGATTTAGLSEVLAGKAELDAAVAQSKLPTLLVAAGGTPTDAPYGLIAAPPMAVLVDELGAHFDALVIVAPPVLDNAESLLLAALADESVLVVASGAARKDDLAEASRLLEQSGAPIGGVLFADVPRRGPDSHWR